MKMFLKWTYGSIYGYIHVPVALTQGFSLDTIGLGGLTACLSLPLDKPWLSNMMINQPVD